SAGGFRLSQEGQPLQETIEGAERGLDRVRVRAQRVVGAPRDLARVQVCQQLVEECVELVVGRLCLTPGDRGRRVVELAGQAVLLPAVQPCQTVDVAIHAAQRLLGRHHELDRGLARCAVVALHWHCYPGGARKRIDVPCSEATRRGCTAQVRRGCVHGLGGRGGCAAGAPQ